MPKIKLPRSNPSLDMTPMVDLAFLLVTFFMLTTQFRANEPVIVDMPKSTSEITPPDFNIITLTLKTEKDKDGTSKDLVYFNMDNKDRKREDFIKRLAEITKIKISDADVKTFGNLSGVGMPVNGIPEFLQKTRAAQGEGDIKQPGIPVDSVHNELDYWVQAARETSPSARFAVRGDKGTNFELFKRVYKVMVKHHANRFNLITTMETGSN